MNIIFMGTPEFAVESLKALVEHNYNIVAVVTMPDKPMGRHQDVLQASPVKEYAVAQGIPVLQPEKLKDPAFLEELRSYQADLQIVVAFRMLPEVVWSMPRLGTFNLHAALLPQYRGAAPINWAVINGDKETGATTFFLDHDIDTGRVIYREKVPIHETDNVENVYDRLMHLGANLVLRTVDDIQAGTITPIPQEELITDEPLRPAPKIFRETCQMHLLDGTWTARRAYNFIRGLSPYPGAWISVKQDTQEPVAMKIFASEIVKEADSSVPSPSSLVLSPSSLLLSFPDGSVLRLLEIQIPGKKRMKVEDFLRGNKVQFELAE